MTVKIQIFILICSTLVLNLQANKEEITWQDCVYNYIKYKSAVYETILLIDDKQNLPPTIETLVQTIHKTLPIQKFNNYLKITPSFSTDSSLFIIFTYFEQRNNMKNFAKHISSIAQNKRRPKLLIIVYKKTNSEENRNLTYYNLFQTMWSELILDATVVEVMNVELKFKKGIVLNDLQNEKTVIYYNPYSNITTESNITSNTDFFPDKTKDLKGQKIKIGFQNYPPDNILKLNKLGQIYSLSGFNAIKMIALSEKMNFLLEKSFISNWGVISCSRKNVMGFYRQLLSNELQATAFEHPRYSVCDNKFYEFSKGTKVIPVSLVVPEIPGPSPPTHNWKLLEGVAVLSLIAFMWIVSHVLHFDLREWHAIYMIQLVLNTTTPHKPTKIEERIVFASMMWACFFHSSYIYMSFTDFGLNTDERSKFQSVQDVLKSGLEIIIDNNYAEMLYNNSDGDIRILLDKAIRMKITEEECITQMVTNKNLTCVAREDHAQYVINRIPNKCGKSVMKILDETLWVFVSNIYLAPASPYVKKFDTLIQRFLESGMKKKWQEAPFNSSDFLEEEDISCSSNKTKLDQELHNLLVILAFGYFTCTTVFFAELLMRELLKRFKNRFLLFVSKAFH